MDPGAPTEPPRGSGALQQSLESVFQHPDGLQTARDLVHLVASQWFSPNRSTRSEPATMPEEGSAEVEGILKDILAFNESYRQELSLDAPPSESGVASDMMDVDGANAEPAPLSTPSELPATSKSSDSSTAKSIFAESKHATNTVNPVHAGLPMSRSLSEKSPENELRSIFSAKAMNTSIFQGTESPYRVESPAAQPPVASSQQPQHSHKDNDTYAANARTIEPSRARFPISRLDETPSPNRSLLGNAPDPNSTSIFGRSNDASVSNNVQFKSSSGFAIARDTLNIDPPEPAASQRAMGVNSNSEVMANLNEPPAIKSFLPVNKTVADHKTDHAISHRPDTTRSGLAKGSSNSFKPTSGTLFTTLQSPSPPPSFATPHLAGSLALNELSSPGLTDTESDTDGISSSRKRKHDIDNALSLVKRLKTDQAITKGPKRVAKRTGRSKELKSEQAKEKLPQAIWMRILEFTPPNFLTKARLINKSFKAMVDQFDSIFINCRKENFGWDMPPPPLGLTERQYSDLFGGKGCLEPGCSDELSSRTHWSWAKRWCQECWKGKIEREDRAIKKYQNQYGRLTLTKLLECIPVGVHDSFMKPHDYIDNIESRERQAPRLYKYYLSEDVERVIKEYEELTPAPFVENPAHSAEEKASARADHQKLMDGLEDKRNDFFATCKKATDEHMAQVQKIETAVREKRDDNRKPNNANRNARKALFLRRAQEDLPQIPSDFVKTTKAFKAATRIFRDGGSERGWQTLKPKIEKEWEDSSKTQRAATPTTGLDGAMDEDVVMTDDRTKPTTLPSLAHPNATGLSHRSVTGYPSRDFYGLATSSITDIGSSMAYRGHSSHTQHLGGMYSSSSSTRPSPHLTYLGGSFLPQPSFMNNSTNSVYSHLPNHYQHMMGSASFHNHQPSLHGNHHAPRPMSIPSLLADPPRLDAMGMRFGNGHSQSHYMG